MNSPVKGFSLYVESEDVAVAIAELENALSQFKSGDKAFKESGTIVGNVRVSYCHLYCLLCAAMECFSSMLICLNTSIIHSAMVLPYRYTVFSISDEVTYAGRVLLD